MIIEIPIKVDSRLGLNKQYSGKHWSVRNREAMEVHTAVKLALMQYPYTMFKKPVKIKFYYNSRLDCDNHGYLNKLIIDALKGLVIQDDDKRYVKEITTCFQSKSKNIILEISEY